MTTLRASLLVWLFAAGACHAQTINKCTVDGKVTYTEQPCQGGAASVIAVPDAPPPNPAASAELQRMQHQANALQRERHQREAQDERAQQQAARAAQQRNKQCAQLRLQKKWADDEVRGALAQSAGRAKIKAQRAADKLALACPA
ncbi:hypothetical protein GCM10027277_08400 [Pseudoduganella ginsengisoli]|uniref:DUF4124 domain-containing protein n=1 Tax=Pseudoduganella ginsengisoli TaxID=1462440 RepID=A0A6L6Q0Q3_9BURK|nr:DUF4124 domain-containing protein [Pseudoduganella ginsengisoli]MTW03220.1 DUF4124 domain-containing protein [Pseudoduganella ginsengisoli]